ncbi:hypothetical protein BpHYR1_009434 [Brachionus plicatilis]|uniref:Uncharacterized protein n=1 Tax=Brachionus plicatilis TaxID=10195 RepID=A0A3M7R5E2_BRAPC|nr:hypothetical protein BpHYR1_009434 [Brachionus plicatilis]
MGRIFIRSCLSELNNEDEIKECYIVKQTSFLQYLLILFILFSLSLCLSNKEKVLDEILNFHFDKAQTI